MPRNMNWLRTTSMTDKKEIRGFATQLTEFANDESIPQELSAHLQTFAGYFQTLADEAEDKDKEKETALNRLVEFTTFAYGGGQRIVEILEPQKAESFLGLLRAINAKFDLRLSMDTIAGTGIPEGEADGLETMKIDQEIGPDPGPQKKAPVVSPIVLRQLSQEEMAGAPDLLDQKQKALLSGLKEMQQLSEMFHTKKSFRLFNWNSDKYNTARDTLDQYIATMETASSDYKTLLNRLEKKEITEAQFATQVKEIGQRINQAADDLRRDMRVYAVHATGGKNDKFGNLSVDDKTQATGAARMAASMGILDILDRADARNGIKTEQLSEKRKQERVNEISFTKLYHSSFSNIQKESDRHRRSASYAKVYRELDAADAKKAQKAQKADTRMRK